MKSEGFNAHSRSMILKYAQAEKNVSHTCRQFGISRTTFYKWHRAYQRHGLNGLKNKERKKPQMPNKVGRAIENEILAYVAAYPADGPKRIYYELKSQGVNISESGIYNVLRRYNLSQKTQRIIYSKNKRLHPKKQQNQDIKSDLDQKQEVAYPGQFVIHRIDYIGKFDGIGKIYQYCLYDVYSKLGVVKLYNRRKDIDIWYHFQLKIVYLLKTFNLTIDHLVTIKSKELMVYFLKGNKYQEIMEHLNIKHSFVEHDKHSLLHTTDDFIEILIKGFYSRIGTDYSLDSFAKAEREFNRFLRHYNFVKTIAKGCNAGKTPAEVILERAAQNNVDFDTLPLWILSLLNQPKGVDYDG